MAKYVYPAVFTPEADGGYSINFPDLPSCYTQGDDMIDAYRMAEDILCAVLCDIENEGAKPAVPSAPVELAKGENEFVALVGADTTEYRRVNDSKAIKKTLSIPNWLNVAAEREGVNFSQILQDALKERLGLI